MGNKTNLKNGIQTSQLRLLPFRLMRIILSIITRSIRNQRELSLIQFVHHLDALNQNGRRDGQKIRSPIRLEFLLIAIFNTH